MLHRAETTKEENNIVAAAVTKVLYKRKDFQMLIL